ncbi:MAG: PEP-utilizing enzyme [Patescibacteria group bacterium]
MKKYVLSHEEYSISPLTISPNHNAWPSNLLIKLLDGRRVGEKTFCEHKKQMLLFYVDYVAWDKGSDYLIGKIQEKPEFVKQVRKESEAIVKVLLKLIRDVENEDLDQWTNRQLASYLQKTYKLANELCVWGYVPVFSDHYFQKYSHLLKKIVKRAVDKNNKSLSIPEIVNTLSSPVKPIPSKTARIELMKMIVNTAGRNVEERKVSNYYKKWNWVNFGQLGPRTTFEEVKLSIQELVKNKKEAKKELTDLLNYAAALREKQLAVFKKLGLNDQEKYLFSVAQIFTYLKGLRMEVLFGVYSQWEKILSVASKRFKLPKKLLYYCSKSELVNWLSAGKAVLPEVLQERSKYCVWIALSEDRQIILTGKKAREYVKQNVKREKQKIQQVIVIHGTVASAGYAKGRVKIVNEASKIAKVKNGDILVSVATTPSLLPAMKRASAFVTDVGGLTSHAAIVAREMKKPCIIGAKIATKVLKDGDLVELDTRKGDIKIVS